MSLTVEPEDGETELFGKDVADLQEGIVLANGAASGTLKYVTGYTGYSGDPDLQEGNYIACKCTSDAGAVLTVELLGGEGDPVTLDSDMNFVCRVSDHTTQSIKVTATKDGQTTVRTYSLAGLTCEEATE